MATTPAPEIVALLRDFPRWEGWRGVPQPDGAMLYMRFPKSSPPVVLKDRDPAKLREQVQAWHDDHPSVAVRPEEVWRGSKLARLPGPGDK